MRYKKIAGVKNVAELKKYASELNIKLPVDQVMQKNADSVLSKPLEYKGKKIGNRFCVLPMEGWDCESDGSPTDLTIRRWKNFGRSGAKLIWGGEAAAVSQDGRSNPAQMMINDKTVSSIAKLREALVDAHKGFIGDSSDLYIGLQLTHSGRFSKPNSHSRYESRVAYNHPILDKKFNFDEKCKVLSDDEVDRLVDAFIDAAELSYKAGFDFVDVKHCHGYLGHEFLTAFDRPGKYGGNFENRTRFLKNIIQGIQAKVPALDIGVRLSLFDFIPFKKGADGVGIPEAWEGNYPYAFGGDGTGFGIDLTETFKVLDLLADLGVRLICSTVGSPYYNPHIQRPALFPPSDGYLPPEDPLVGVERQIQTLAKVKKEHPDMIYVGCGYTYLQEWIPNVSQAVIRNNMADFIGLGRMMLPYPDIVKDIIEGNPLQRNRICRTFSDCTTAPRKGIISGCYPLDSFYKQKPEFEQLKKLKG